MARIPAPHVPPALVEWLQQVFPDRLPSRVEAHTDYARLTGQQDVVRKLESLVRAQAERDVRG